MINLESVDWDKCYIREYKGDGLYWSIACKKSGFFAQELAISTMYVKGGQDIKTDYYYDVRQIAEVMKDPIKFLECGLIDVLVKSRVIQREGIINKINGKKIPINVFKERYPEYFV